MHFNKNFFNIPFLQYIKTRKMHIVFILLLLLIFSLLIGKIHADNMPKTLPIPPVATAAVDHTYHFAALPAHLHDPFHLAQNNLITKKTDDKIASTVTSLPEKTISPINTDIHLIGIITNKNKSIAIFAQNKKVFSVKVGEQVSNLTVIEIRNDSVITKNIINHLETWHINDFQ